MSVREPRPTGVLPAVGVPPAFADLSLADIEAVRLLLAGESVIDWHSLTFSDHAEVDRFLRLNEFDPDSADEMARLEDIRLDAVEYLTRAFSMTIPDAVADNVAARDLLLMASRQGPHQRWACVVLKVMHIIHHINGRAALLKISASDDYIFREIELKVMQVVEQLRAAGAPIAEFEWSRKSIDSQITKLLAKRSTLAASIYDKLRFRLIVSRREDLLPTLATLVRQLIPFNYVVPGESVNHLIDLKSLDQATEAIRNGHSILTQRRRGATERMPINEFSGAEYRIVNFVADLPLRLERLVPKSELNSELSHVVFALTEFQIADKQTALQNETGDCSHEAYKARQHSRVKQRLFSDGESDPE
ncbi:MAG: TIGR04552 family protein [Kofleriaceae bacterium]